MPDSPVAPPGENVPLLQTVTREITSRDRDSLAITIRPDISGSSSTCRQHASHNNSNATTGSSNGENVLGTCRICLETETAESQDPTNPLISPCLCSGGSKYVHRNCLSQWRATNHRADAYFQCEVCKYRYRYRRLWWAGILGSNVTVLVMFLLLMASLITALGFIPVIPWLSSSSSAKGSSSGGGSSPAPPISPSPPGGSTVQPWWVTVLVHVTNGLIMMGVLGLALTLVLLVLRACGVNSFVFMQDPCCPCCWCCLDLSGGPGLGWAPFLECGAAGECGAALLVVMAIVLLFVGFMVAAYMIYAVLWSVVQMSLDKAQHMVENVQQEREEVKH